MLGDVVVWSIVVVMAVGDGLLHFNIHDSYDLMSMFVPILIVFQIL